MDNKEALSLARQFADAVKSKYDFKKIFLFGSFVKGTATNDSDIDIAVVFDNYSESENMQLELMRIRRKIDSRIEPHPFRVNDFNNNDPLAHEILKHGIEILN